MMTHKQRVLAAARGEMADRIPFAPRLDLWYNANSAGGTLPQRHLGHTSDEIARAEGWALHKVVPEYDKPLHPEEDLHRALGLYSLKEFVFKCRFSPDVEIKIHRQGGCTHVEYHTPLGMVSTTTSLTDEMRRSGTSLSWIDEHAIKRREDYRVVAYLFDHLELLPKFEDFTQWQKRIGDDGLPVTMVAGGASPIHHIQRDLLDATSFYYHYRDYEKEMRELAASIENFYTQALKIVGQSPAEAVLWGGNFDDMLTYPPYFEKEILPWIRRASETLGAKGKIVICHCDGENLGLIDMIRESGMHVAESVCPYPMTKVKIEEYYQRWSDKLTLFGGIPSDLLLAELTTREEFEDYLDRLFKVVAPGNRLILGIADATPADAAFDRMVRIQERVEKEGGLPLEGGGFRPVSQKQVREAAGRAVAEFREAEIFKGIREAISEGDQTGIKEHIKELIEKGLDAREILQRGMISAMEVIGERFKAGDVFIPEVLLSARAMNEALSVLEPYLSAGGHEASGKVLMGTVQGDYHDIGKNIVINMLRGVGFEVRDMGINVPIAEIVRQVAEYKPDILGLSALLTTTLPEMKRVIRALEENRLRDHVKVIVGGAPVNEKFARSIGADGYGQDAGEAVKVAKHLLRK
jgi:corrinoid protein of di/trimethylamine methyltransferase